MNNLLLSYALWPSHYNDVIVSTMASQITSLMTVNSTVYSGADQRKHQSSASLAFVRGIHQWSMNSPHKGPVMRKVFPFDDVIMSNDLMTRPKFSLCWPFAGESIGHRWIPLVNDKWYEALLFYFGEPAQFVGQAFELPVIWNARAHVWCHSNGYVLGSRERELIWLHYTDKEFLWEPVVIVWSKYLNTKLEYAAS